MKAARLAAANGGRFSPGRLALAGLVSLAVAMGIGRFAFTPLLPMMLSDGVVDLAGASWLASANYFGYVLGAVLCVAQPAIWQRLGLAPFRAAAWVRGGLTATVLLTLGMALPVPVAWPTLRFAAGVASALVFVFTSGWCLARLAERGAPALGGLIYVGPGIGIAVGGLLTSGLVALDSRAASGWLLFGVLAALLAACIWRVFDASAVLAAAPPATATHAAPAGSEAPVEPPTWRVELGLLTAAYALAGFGYIITATFLPVIARQALANSAWLDFFWPLFGIGSVVGALLSTRLHGLGDLRRLLVGCYLMQALGIAIGLWSPSLAGFAVGSLLVGLPFTALTFFAMQEVRRLRPLRAAPAMGLLTAMYGIGQVLGPQLVAWLLVRSASPAAGFERALEAAAGALLLGAALLAAMSLHFPRRPG